LNPAAWRASLSALCFSPAAQFSIPRSTMAGGGGVCTGGFWALPQAVQTPGAPTLTIVPASPGFATVSWTPPSGTNWVLQQAAAVTGPWTNAPSGWTNPVTVPTTLPTKFYRLFKP